MNATQVFALRSIAPRRPLARSGTHWLPLPRFVAVRLLVTYRGEAPRLRALVPDPFALDECDGFGFLSVCGLEVRSMGAVGLPEVLTRMS